MYVQIVLKVHNRLNIQKYVQIVINVHNRLNVQKIQDVQIVINVRNRLNVQNHEICANCHKGAQPLKCTKICKMCMCKLS